MSLINKEISDFSVKAFHHNELTDVSKKDVLGKWSLFFFYPADFTFVCPTELEDLASKYEAFQKAECEIYSVSCDTAFVHKAWHDEAGVAERGAFIVNPEGRIVSYEVTAGNVGRNADELFRKLQACQFVYEHGDEVCPAKWQPGEKTLKPSLDLVGQL